MTIIEHMGLFWGLIAILVLVLIGAGLWRLGLCVWDPEGREGRDRSPMRRTDKALLALCLLAVSALLIILPAAQADAAVIQECSIADLTDEPATVPGHRVAIMREDGRRAIYRHLPHQRAYQIFAGNGPQMQMDYLCLPPLPDFQPEENRDE